MISPKHLPPFGVCAFEQWYVEVEFTSAQKFPGDSPSPGLLVSESFVNYLVLEAYLVSSSVTMTAKFTLFEKFPPDLYTTMLNLQMIEKSMDEQYLMLFCI